MATTTPATTVPPTPAVPEDALRVVLFGMPDAGKSSLLGALAQSAQTQERILQGRLFDIPPGMEELRRRVYENRPTGTLEEIVPYPLTFEPFQGTQSNPVRVPLVVYDCDGRVANELLTRRKSFDTDTKAGSLAEAVLDADALVLVIDAAASPEQIDADFREFTRFLKFLNDYRTKDRMVGGLPVFLTLSKCDLLVRDGESSESWVARIDDKKGQVFDRFAEFMKRSDREHPGTEWLGFGSIGLDVHSTAVVRPVLENQPSPPLMRPEPFGVAELFHHCIDAAKAYRARAAHSDTRLMWTLGLAVALIAAMLVFGGIVLMRGEGGPESPLLAKVQNFQGTEPQTASQRLRESTLLTRLAVLTELHDDPDFKKLPKTEREYVEGRLKEMKDYRLFREAFTNLSAPAEVTTIQELDRLQKSLTDANIPDEYKTEWAQTEAVKLRTKWAADIPLLRDAINKVNGEYLDMIGRGSRLLFAGTLDGTWQGDVRDLMQRDASPTYPENKLIPESETLPFPRDKPLKYKTAYAIVDANRRQWETTRDKILLLNEMAMALGILGNPNDERAVLVFGPSNIGTDISALETKRWSALKRAYPRYREWSLNGLPEAMKKQIGVHLQSTRDQLIRDGQLLISKKLISSNVTPGKETFDDWKSIGNWLSESNNLTVQDYRELLLFVEQLLTPGSPDSITKLILFLRKDTFDLEFNVIRLKIPTTLDPVVRPAGKFIVYFKGTGDTNTKSLFFKADDGGMADGTGFYRFVLDGNDQMSKFTYKPSDQFWATLPVQDNSGRQLQFTWSDSRSPVFQFERLHRDPKLAAPNAAAGQRAEKVIVEVLPLGGVPTVPDLLPNTTN